MPQPIAAFTGDNHLRPITWTKHPDLYGDAYAAFRQFFDYCLEHRLPAILLGDTFDKTRPDSMSVGTFLWNMWRMEQARLEVYYIEGNHDAASPPWPSLSPWARPVGKFQLSGIEAYGLSFTNGSNLAAELALIQPGVRLLLAHQSWLEIQRVGHTDGTFGMIPHGLVMLTGDYHVCGTYTGPAANGETVTAHSPGSTAMQALNEPAIKYFGILYDDLSVTWQPLTTRPIVSMACQTDADLDAVVQRLLEGPPPSGISQHADIAKPILRVRYDDSLPEAYTRLLAAAGDAFHVFLEPQHQTLTEVIDQAAIPQTAFESLMSAVVELTPAGSPLADAACRLLRSADPKAELELLFTEFKAAYALANDSARVQAG